MPIKIDMTNPESLKRPKPTVVDPGMYQCVVTNKLREVACRAPSENTMVKVCLKILDEGEFYGKLIWDQIVISPKTMWNLYQFSRSCGIDPADNGGIVELPELDGAECTAEFDTDMYKNQPRSIVKAYRFEGDDEKED